MIEFSGDSPKLSALLAQIVDEIAADRESMCFFFPENSRFMQSDKRQEMWRYVISIGRPVGLIEEITWKVGNLEVICRWQARCYRMKLFILALS